MTIRDIGLTIVRMAPWLEGAGRWIYARLPEFLRDTPTSWLRASFARERRITFVQIGANDGLADDPIRPLVVESDRWRGLFVEPQPDAFASLQRNYQAQASRLEFVNAAVSDEPGERTLYCIPETERQRLGLPDWVGRVASFSEEHLRKHLHAHSLSDAKPIGRGVRTITFAEVADRLPAGHVDVVVIDVEGHERAILETIDLDRHRIRYIIYEHAHLSESDRLQVKSKLQMLGFALKEIHGDTVAWRSLTSTPPSA